MLAQPANRWQAFGLHLVISLLLFLVLAGVIYFWWYPGILFWYDGGMEGMRLIAGVDFFIGPLLTLLVYKVGKKTLRFDLTCIAVLQVVCLVAGMMTVWLTRPVAVVYAENTFRSISYHVYEDYGVVPSSVPLLRGRWPVWIWVVEGGSAGRDLFGNPQHDARAHFAADRYLPFSNVLPRLGSAGFAVEQINPGMRASAQALAAGNTNVRFYLATLGSGAGFMAVDTSNGQALGFLPSMPREVSILGYLNQSKVFVVEFFNTLFKRS